MMIKVGDITGGYVSEFGITIHEVSKINEMEDTVELSVTIYDPAHPEFVKAAGTLAQFVAKTP